MNTTCADGRLDSAVLTERAMAATASERGLTGGRVLRRYTHPRLTLVANTADLLEVLGPAQAGYGTP
jgi:hypothetical protein